LQIASEDSHIHDSAIRSGEAPGRPNTANTE
jgi:hypothetical protein